MDYYVICVDNYCTGRKSNISHLIGLRNFEALTHDATLPLYVDVDEIYNLACPASPVQYKIDPIQTMKTSFLGAINVLGLAKRTGAKVLQASTSEIYGDPEVHPQKETYFGNVNVCGPRACYDEGKRAAETLFYDYRRQHGVRTKVVRIFNTYGPRMRKDDGRVISNFIVQALRGEPLTICGDGKQTRSFCYVDDLVDGLLAMMESPEDVGGPVNIGNPEEVTIADVANRVATQTGSLATTRRIERTDDDPNRRCPDITLMKSLTGWSPKVTLDEGLAATIDYFRKAEASDSTKRTRVGR
jgi:UDP-glucuronate decarboxylase